MKKTLVILLVVLFASNLYSQNQSPLSIDADFRAVTLTKTNTVYLKTNFNADSSTYKIIEVHKVAGIPRSGIVTQISKGKRVGTVDTITYLPDSMSRELYIEAIFPNQLENKNSLLFVCEYDFRVMFMDALTGEFVIDTMFAGQKDFFVDTTFIIGKDLSPIDSANSSRELWGTTEITPVGGWPTDDNEGALIDYDFLPNGWYFIIMRNDEQDLFYIRTMEKK